MDESKFHSTDKLTEKAILVAVEEDKAAVSADDSLDELDELARTAGAEVLGRLIQKRDKAHPGHYLGKGKIEELKDMIQLLDANTVICDDELSPAQLKKMAELLDVKIIDRTMLILDIFAQRAQSQEGKVQVELAQLKYSLSRLGGLGIALSRLGGGIGTRGPGESKLETDRRHIRSRISDLQSELRDIKMHRSVQRERRERSNIPVVSFSGYTNVGKSTLMNLLTCAGVLEEDKLFATLDTTTRRIKLPGGTEVLLSDTVGFIRKLPHHLVSAFRATLEELRFADVLLHVVDASNSMREWQMETVYKTLKDLECIDKIIITLYNKMDKEVELPLPADKVAGQTHMISAKTGAGKDGLLELIENALNSRKKKLMACLPYSEGHLLNFIHSRCEIFHEEHSENGTIVGFYADSEAAGRLERYLIGFKEVVRRE